MIPYYRLLFMQSPKENHLKLATISLQLCKNAAETSKFHMIEAVHFHARKDFPNRQTELAVAKFFRNKARKHRLESDTHARKAGISLN